MSVYEAISHAKSMSRENSSLSELDLIKEAEEYLIRQMNRYPSTGEAQRIRDEIGKEIIARKEHLKREIAEEYKKAKGLME